jgi:hypothetical protein
MREAKEVFCDNHLRLRVMSGFVLKPVKQDKTGMRLFAKYQCR